MTLLTGLIPLTFRVTQRNRNLALAQVLAAVPVVLAAGVCNIYRCANRFRNRLWSRRWFRRWGDIGDTAILIADGVDQRSGLAIIVQIGVIRHGRRTAGINDAGTILEVHRKVAISAVFCISHDGIAKFFIVRLRYRGHVRRVKEDVSPGPASAVRGCMYLRL